MFKFARELDFTDILQGFDMLTDNCIARLFSYNAIKKIVKDQTGFEDEVCDIIAKKIDENFSELKLNYIISNLNNNDE